MDEGWSTTLRPCGKCGEWLPVEMFHRRGPNGNIAWCKPCRKIYDAAYERRTRPVRMVQKRKRNALAVAWMRGVKSGPCADCGKRFHPAAMTFDHLPGTTKRKDVAALAGGGMTRAARAEIEKCELVCANCHAVRTFMRREAAKAA